MPFALAMALLLECSRLVQLPREFSQDDLDRIWNLSTLLFLGLAMYAFTFGEGALAVVASAAQNNARTRADVLARSVQSVFLFFQWMPFCFLPIVAAQAWSRREAMALS